MARRTPVCLKHKPNEQRSLGKQKRGVGKLAMKAAGLDFESQADCITWSQKHDPLFHIKGKERHRFLSLNRS